MRKTLLALAVAFIIAPVSLAVRVHAEVLDSVTVTLACKNWTIRATGHGLSHPNAAIQYIWSVSEGGLGFGLVSMGVADALSLYPRQDETFMASITKPELIPPFDNVFGAFGTATLTTGAMTWNTVAITFAGTFECPSLNRCPLTQAQWRNRKNWPAARLVLGNPFPNPAPLVYDDAKARAILRRAPASDASIELAQQLIATKLNMFNGTPRVVADPSFGSPSGDILFFLVTDEADKLLENGRLPQHVDPVSSLGQQMAADTAILQSYNTGAFTTKAPDGTCQ
jgi:hypothetical protein